VTHPLGTYSFLPWLRLGIAGKIDAVDGDSSVTLRATVPVGLKLAGEPVSGTTVLERTIERKIQLVGPGDIVGLDPRVVFRTEPRNWITNSEPNFLAHVEFYDEDLPWRYTPAAPDPSGLKLRPWLTLIVLEEGKEFAEATNLAGRPLPFITVTNPAALFPNANDLWAWAHTHVNKDLAANPDEFVAADMPGVLARLRATLDTNADLGFSRIVCPRQLGENRAYHGFLVPTFEAGRLAGLGLDPAGAPHATVSAWETYPGRENHEPGNFPIYFRWYFRTGSQGDFEFLVRLLEPKPVDSRVGRRDIDVQDPGSNIPGILDADLGGVLKLGGALRIPCINFTTEEWQAVKKYEKWAEPYPHPFQTSLAAFINLPDDYAAVPPEEANSNSGLDLEVIIDGEVENDPDPLITAPLYGRWHALIQRLLRDRNGNPLSPDRNWVHTLNLDPRHRVSAGFGTSVVQKNQEDYMLAAWEQIGDVLEANRRIRLAQLAREASAIWYDRHLRPLVEVRPERAFALTAPLHRHVVTRGLTVQAHKKASLVQPAATSVAFRRAIRPGGRLVRSLPFDDTRPLDSLLTRMDEDEEVSPAPPKQTPAEISTVDQIADDLLPQGVPQSIVDLLRRFPWLGLALLVLLLLIAVVLLVVAAGILTGLIAGILVVVGIGLWWLSSRWLKKIRQSDAVRPERQTPESVDELPQSPDFVITSPGSGFTPSFDGTDSAEAARFKTALRDWGGLNVASKTAAAEPAAVSLGVERLAQATIAAIDPDLTIKRRVLAGISLPARVIEQLTERFQEVMAYPRIDLPMYGPLVAISGELFLPNINLIEQNSITLLETNQKFIESYMVGLNHEFARELLWREYPTDQRGSYFRQFWDVGDFLTSETMSDEELRESLFDIPELHLWSPFSQLGDHDNRELPGENEQEAVLVIRGELLKKYPTAVIYAHRADWQKDDNGDPDPSQERVLVEVEAFEEDHPPRTKVRTPLYEAKVPPDIYFFGFDLTVPEAKGGSGEPGDMDPGWFFVIKERPGDPRFGFDIEREGPVQTFNDLAWKDDLSAVPVGGFVPASAFAPVALAPLGPGDDEKTDQRKDDDKINAAPPNAGRWAYILYQAPVMVAIHAAEMLRPKGPDRG
jgi:hypothetical protein